VAGTGNFTGLRINSGTGIDYTGKVLASDADGNAIWSNRVILGNPSNPNPDGKLEVDDNGDYGLNIVSHSTNTGRPTKLFLGTNGTDAVFWVTSTGQTIIGKPLTPSSAHYFDYMLSVNGKIVGKTVVATSLNWSDFVFDSNYKLTSLKETEEYIKQNHHLPSIPSEAEVKANGIDLADMDAKLLEKIEVLYLHVIEVDKKNDEQQKKIEVLEKQIQELKK